MDVAHAILFAKAIDISRVTADYSSAKFESYICHRSFAHYAGHDEYAKNLSYSRDFWDGFQLSSTYNKMMGQGGTKSQKDVDELMAAAEAYRWEKAYRKFDVYDEDMFEFADKMCRDTGVMITTGGGDQSTAITHYFGNRLCSMGNAAFQFMAKHQENIGIWKMLSAGNMRRLMNCMRLCCRQGISDWKPIGR